MFAFNEKEAKEDTGFKKLAINKFYVDEVYEIIIIKPLLIMSKIIDRFIDPKIFDGFINFNVWGYTKSATLFAKMQNGKVRFYALYILMGVSAMSAYMLIKLGAL